MNDTDPALQVPHAPRRSPVLNFDVVFMITIGVLFILSFFGWRDQRVANQRMHAEMVANRKELESVRRDLALHRQRLAPAVELMKGIAQAAGIDSNLIASVPSMVDTVPSLADTVGG